jgi:hypothetical protein
LAAIAAGRAPPRLSRLQNGHISATLSEVESRRQSSRAAADHNSADALVAGERRGRDCGPRSFGIKAARQPRSVSFNVVGHIIVRLHSPRRARDRPQVQLGQDRLILYSRKKYGRLTNTEFSIIIIG